MTSKKIPLQQYTFLIVVTCAAMIGLSVPAHGDTEDILFMSVDEMGLKVWKGDDAVELKDPLLVKAVNMDRVDHGFTIDTMKISAVIPPGEAMTFTVPRESMNRAVGEHRVYCQLHPKHVDKKFKTTGMK